MSIEQKIAAILAESKLEEAKFAGAEGGQDSGKHGAQAGDQSPIRDANQNVPNGGETPNPDNARNNVDNEDEAANATSKKTNRATASAAAGDQTPIRKGSTVKEDIDALMSGEALSEEFREKATTIFEAAVMTRVNEEVARIEEEFEAKLDEALAQNIEGLVEQVDGYLNYVVEQWIEQNEIALESGMKSDILEGFIGGLKDLFVEHYIDVPEEKFDVLGALEEQVETLETKLNEQVATNIELHTAVGKMNRASIVAESCEGLTDTEIEKFTGLVEELSYDNEDSFKKKVQTIRENYFTNKAQHAGVSSVVTDSPVESLTESKSVDPTMAAYLSMLDRK